MRNNHNALPIGALYDTKKCGQLKVIEYRGARDVDVEFVATGTIVTTRKDTILLGHVRDVMYPTVFGIGYIGFGEHIVSERGVHTKKYLTWIRMMSRCYSETTQKTQPTYVGCDVCSDWHNFQNFARWFDENYTPDGHLDKDIRIDKNKTYSPLACQFVTRWENNQKAKAKNYTFTSPTGERVDIYNLRKFCMANNLHPSAMIAVKKGVRTSHKKWTA